MHHTRSSLATRKAVHHGYLGKTVVMMKADTPRRFHLRDDNIEQRSHAFHLLSGRRVGNSTRYYHPVSMLDDEKHFKE